MILLMSDDASTEISLRLARFPEQNLGTVWLHVATEAGAWSLADESFELASSRATPVAEDTVSFDAWNGAQSIRFDAVQRNSGKMQGRVTGKFLVSATRHPESIPGDIPVTVDLRFDARSEGYKNQGRWEMTGQVSGFVTVDDNSYFMAADGKWHEQTGPRAGFAPAFRYFNVQNSDAAILAIQYAERFRGYAMLGDGIHDLTAVAIDPPGSYPGAERKFSLTLDNGQNVSGTARIVQEWSVPIEGQRRPGASVVVDSNLGRLTGSLNDWEPR